MAEVKEETRVVSGAVVMATALTPEIKVENGGEADSETDHDHSGSNGVSEPVNDDVASFAPNLGMADPAALVQTLSDFMAEVMANGSLPPETLSDLPGLIKTLGNQVKIEDGTNNASIKEENKDSNLLQDKNKVRGKVAEDDSPVATNKRTSVKDGIKSAGEFNDVCSRTCSQCGKVFSQKMHLQRHVKSVHEHIRDNLCAFCGKAFMLKSHLMEHIRAVHFKIKNHVCPVCMWKFNRVGDLNRHMKNIHTEGKKQRKRRKQQVSDGDSSSPLQLVNDPNMQLDSGNAMVYKMKLSGKPRRSYCRSKAMSENVTMIDVKDIVSTPFPHDNPEKPAADSSEVPDSSLSLEGPLSLLQQYMYKYKDSDSNSPPSTTTPPPELVLGSGAKSVVLSPQSSDPILIDLSNEPDKKRKRKPGRPPKKVTSTVEAKSGEAMDTGNLES